MLITSQDIINFIDDIISSSIYKPLFSDVWIEFRALYDLYHHIKNLENKIAIRMFRHKLNFVCESKSYGIHIKKTWSESDHVSYLKRTF